MMFRLRPHQIRLHGLQALSSGLSILRVVSEPEYIAGMASLDDPAIIDAPFANLAVWGRATRR
jgi:hypothetical protein